MKTILPARLKILSGGRKLTRVALLLVYVQTLIYIVMALAFNNFNLHIAIYIALLIVTYTLNTILLSIGVYILLFTSRRLGVIRRVVVFFTFLIPVLHIIILLYACRVVSDEIDHELNKVVNRNARVDSQVCQTKTLSASINTSGQKTKFPHVKCGSGRTVPVWPFDLATPMPLL